MEQNKIPREPKPEVPFWDIAFTNQDGEREVKEVKGFTHAEAVSEFNLFYGRESKSIIEVKSRQEATKPVLV